MISFHERPLLRSGSILTISADHNSARRDFILLSIESRNMTLIP